MEATGITDVTSFFAMWTELVPENQIDSTVARFLPLEYMPSECMEFSTVYVALALRSSNDAAPERERNRES